MTSQKSTVWNINFVTRLYYKKTPEKSSSKHSFLGHNIHTSGKGIQQSIKYIYRVPIGPSQLDKSKTMNMRMELSMLNFIITKDASFQIRPLHWNLLQFVLSNHNKPWHFTCPLCLSVRGQSSKPSHGTKHQIIRYLHR